MSRKFRMPDYESRLNTPIQLGDGTTCRSSGAFCCGHYLTTRLEQDICGLCRKRRRGDSARSIVGAGLLWIGHRGIQFAQDRKGELRKPGISLCGWRTRSGTRYECQLSDNIFGGVGRFICADIDVGTVGRQAEVGQSQFGWEQDSCRRLKKPCSQLWTVDPTGSRIVSRGWQVD